MKEALTLLGVSEGETARGDTALKTARSAITMLVLSLTGAITLREDELRGVIEPRHELSPRQ